ncbi:MAG TPA: tail fiber protein [Acidobacteriaceae bacterium]|jgi:microcystin-dependent protein
MGSIMMFAGNFAPQNWALCNGQLLAIQSNAALFSILGTTYGGNGIQTFALPNLQCRVPIHAGTAGGLGTMVLGQVGGVQSVTLNSQNMPMHNHTLNVNNGSGLASDPTGAALAQPNTSTDPRNPGTTTGAYMTGNAFTGQAAPGSIGMAGGNIPFNVENPYLVVNFIICTQGIFPPRN